MLQHRPKQSFFFCVGQAETKFENLKRRYRLRKNAVKKAKPSGTGKSKALAKAEAELKAYDFLKWLDPFVSGAESISNLDDEVDEEIGINEVPDEEFRRISDISDDDLDEDSDDDDELLGETGTKATDAGDGSKENVAEERDDGEKQSKQNVKGKKKAPIQKPLSKFPDGVPPLKKTKVTTDQLLATINKRLHDRKHEKLEKRAMKEQEPPIDEFDVFGKMVANELRSLPKRKQVKLKHDINNAIFKYQCEVEEEELYVPPVMMQQGYQQAPAQQQQQQQNHPLHNLASPLQPIYINPQQTPPPYSHDKTANKTYTNLLSVPDPVTDIRLVSAAESGTSSNSRSPYQSSYGSY